MRRAFRLVLVPAVVLTAGACFATRNDVRTLQGDIAVLRAEAARADSVHRELLRQQARRINAVADSLQTLNVFLARWSGDVTLSLHNVGQQLITIQELTGQSQRRLQEMRAEFEAQAAATAAATTPVVPPVTGAATGAPVAGQQPQPGPNQLYSLAFQQLTRGANNAARSGFIDFLAQYPNNELAPDAQYYIAQAFDQDGKKAEADSAYAVVVAKYPKSDRAPVALFKRAGAMVEAGKKDKARALYLQIIDKYPASPEAETAKDRLKTLK